MDYSNILLLISIFYPIIGGLVVCGIGRKNENIRDLAAKFVAITEFVFLIGQLLLHWIGGNISYINHYEEFSWFIRTGNWGSWGPTSGMSGARHFEFTIMMDGFRLLYCTIASFMWMMAAIFSKEYFTHHHNKNRYYLFLLLTEGATIGVFLAGNFLTLFVFFEMMSFTSYVWVAQEETKEALRAAETYLAIAVLGGLVLLMGIFLWQDLTGGLTFFDARLWDNAEALEALAGDPRLYAVGGCMLFGFAAKAGAFPVHIWLPKAHPVAPAPASALLSGILTKTGVLGILIVSMIIFPKDAAWSELILYLGVITMFGGAVLALCSNDLKRTLACSSMSQIGFILVGIGMAGLLRAFTGEMEEGIIAVRGTMLHMVNHSLIKLVLFLVAGVVFMNVHKLDLNSIRGFGRNKPLLHVAYLAGGLSIAGVPLFSGYISKSLLHEGIVEYIHLLNEFAAESLPGGVIQMKIIEWIFLISGGLTFAYITKLYICLFWEKNRNPKLQDQYDLMKGKYINRQSSFAVLGSAVLLPVFGLLPGWTMDKLADMGASFLRAEEGFRVSYFSFENLKGAATSLLIGILVYTLFVRKVMIRREGRITLLDRVETDLSGINVKEREKDVYVDIWPKWLDLENLIYRPFLCKILPTFFGIVCRVLDRFVDSIVLLLRKTIYRDSKLPYELPEGNMLTHALGVFLDNCAALLNRTIWKKRPTQKRFEHKLALLMENMSENSTIIARSLSFGLLLFCIGFLLTIFYLLFW